MKEEGVRDRDTKKEKKQRNMNRRGSFRNFIKLETKMD